MDFHQRDVGGFDGGVGDFNDAGRGKGLNDADGFELAGRNVDGLRDGLEHCGVHAGDLAALNERGSGGSGSGGERGLHAGDVTGDDDEEFARADAARKEKLDRACLEHQVFDDKTVGDAGELDESDGIDFSRHVWLLPRVNE